jgi:peptidoglycan hydrolase-like protein with peptidoglycan-binding domain
MNNRFEPQIFETQPFFFEEEVEDERGQSRRRARVPARRGAAKRQATDGRRRPVKPRLQFPIGFPVFQMPYPAWPGQSPEPAKEPEEPPLDSTPDDTPASQLETGRGREGSRYVRFAQSRLNQLLGLRLPLDGEMGVKTRAAIRSLQRKYGLPVDGIIRPQTERILTGASPFRRQVRTEEEFESEINRSSYEYAVWVQRSLNRILGMRLVEDGIIGTQTRSAIRSFQQRYGLIVDGIVGPQTEGALIRAGAAPPPGSMGSYLPIPPQTGVPVAPTPSSGKELSGPAWVDRFPGSRSVDDLVPPFRDNVKKFLAALTEAGAGYRISATFRPVRRQYLMYWAAQIARGDSTGQNIPSYPGVEIEWWHGSVEASRRAAQEMVDKFQIGGNPVARPEYSLHDESKAIDMSISWTGNLRIRRADGQYVTITSAPKDGTNPDLVEVGKSYKVFHKANDRPHWSIDGR